VGDGRRISKYVAEVSSVELNATIADVQLLGEQRFPVPVIGRGGVLLGTVDPTAAALPGSTPVERVMVPAPGTMRPEVRIEEAAERLHRDRLDHVFITAVNGVLLGLIVTEELHV
jgi:hypothetical protein